MDENKNSTKRRIFIGKAKEFLTEQIKKRENKLKRELTDEERKETRKKNRKKAGFIAAVSASLFVGALGGREIGKLLDSPNTIKVADESENSVTIDAEEIDKVVRVNTDRPVFINGLHVGKDELEIVRNMNQDLEINTRREINSLENKPEQVETYIKTLVANDYNQKHEKDLTANDIEIERSGIRGTIFDVEKGKKCNYQDMKIVIGHSLMPVRYFIHKDGTIDFGEQPPAEKEIMSLPVVVRGLDWIDKGAQNANFQQAFFEAILEYKKSKMKEISTEEMKIDDER